MGVRVYILELLYDVLQLLHVDGRSGKLRKSISLKISLKLGHFLALFSFSHISIIFCLIHFSGF